ncbi:MAG: addiction module antidote protein [Hyphomicrobiales bacterium]
MKTKKAKLAKFDVASLLEDDEAVQVFMDDALETGDAAYIAQALGVVARAKGMSKVARKSGLSRESLYKALSADGNPEFATMLKVMAALDLKFSARVG